MPLRYIRRDIAWAESEVIAVPSGSSFDAPGKAELAVIRRAGKELERRVRVLPPLKPGAIQVLDGLNTDARYIFRVYSPLPAESRKQTLADLEDVYGRIFAQCKKLGCQSAAVALFGAGNHGIAPNLALKAAGQAAEAYLDDHPDFEIIIVLYDRPSFEIARQLQDDIEEFITENYVRAHSYERTRPYGSQAGSESESSMDVLAFQPCMAPSKTLDLEAMDFDAFLEQMGDIDASFSSQLLNLIDKRNE